MIRHVFWKDNNTRLGWITGNKEKLEAKMPGRCLFNSLREMYARKAQDTREAEREGSTRGLFIARLLFFSLLKIFTGSQGVMVVLFLQINRVPGHDILCLAEKNQSDYFSSCISSCLYV